MSENFPSGSIWSKTQVWEEMLAEERAGGSKPIERGEERWEGMLKVGPVHKGKKGERGVTSSVLTRNSKVLVCVYMWMCACIQAPIMRMCVLSSANAMLPSPVGHQKPALAENQQVRSLVLTLSVSWPRWQECKDPAKIPKRAGQWWRGLVQLRYPTEISNRKSVSDENDCYERKINEHMDCVKHTCTLYTVEILSAYEKHYSNICVKNHSFITYVPEPLK